jgi:hypothetical protein
MDVIIINHKLLLIPTLVLAATTAIAADIAPEARHSGYDFAGPETRGMQDDARKTLASWVVGRVYGRRRPGLPTDPARIATVTPAPA